jgi:hypothetical protein
VYKFLSRYQTTNNKLKEQTNMKKLILLGAIVALLSQASHATLSWSSPLTSSSPNIVGIAYGVTGSGQGNDAFKFDVAQILLDMGANATLTQPVGSTSTLFNTFATDYNGTVVTASSASGGAGDSVGSGWDFVIAKYDGQNAGYILFYLGGEAANLPQYPANFWTSNTEKFGISGWTAFDATGIEIIPPTTAVPEPATVIAGALLLIPLGVQAARTLRNRKQ